MKKFLPILLAVFSVLCTPLAAPACGVVPVNPDWPKDIATNCGGPLAEDVLATVSRILLGGADVQRELTDLGRTRGWETVSCAVDQFVADSTKPGAAQTAELLDAVDRAQAFIVRNNVRIDR